MKEYNEAMQKLMENDELKPCPFCGGEALLDDMTDHNIGFFVVCEAENCPVTCSAGDDTREGAIKAWNTRA